MKALPFLLMMVLALPACTRSDKNKDIPDDAPKSGSTPLLFKFNYRAVQEVLISKADPLKGDRWSARFSRSEPDGWRIESGPEDSALIDRRANGKFIEHLLDTLRTFQVLAVAPEGSRESFGLEPPRFAILWRAENTQFELLLGMEDKEGRVYSVIRQQGQGKGSEKVLLLQGAAQKMLALLDGFNFLRLPTWSTLTTDDVDEFEVLKNGKSILYAQRHDTGWADKKLKPIQKPEITKILEELNHNRISTYVDDPATTARILSALKKAPLYEAILTDRQGNATRLSIARIGKKFWGSSSARPGAAFELFPKVLEVFFKVSQ